MMAWMARTASSTFPVMPISRDLLRALKTPIFSRGLRSFLPSSLEVSANDPTYPRAASRCLVSSSIFERSTDTALRDVRSRNWVAWV